VLLSTDCRNTFALITKHMGEKEKLFAFCIVDPSPENNKEEFLTCVSKAICANMCRTDYVSIADHHFAFQSVLRSNIKFHYGCSVECDVWMGVGTF
jgi:hypothetical protein